MSFPTRILCAALTAGAAWIARPQTAEACGCFSPPIPPPMPGAVDFAVNQHAEQIIFEVEPDGHLVAHVLIRYVGDPKQFAWIVPVPSVPELELSYAEAFGLIDQQTSPKVSVSTRNLCPAPLYACRQHPMPQCGSNPHNGIQASAINPGASAPTGASIGPGSGAPPTAPAVTVYARQQVGSYDTVVFGAGDAQGAVNWLQTEGFIVNDTMSPYMQPYLDANMLFVAAKLVPGAGADAIKPLRMRYLGTEPMIPLQLTAVATEPNLTVTAYIYGSGGFAPLDKTLLRASDIPSGAMGATGARNNYPMVLARLFDEDGGQAFMLEYSGAPPRFQPVTFSSNPAFGGPSSGVFPGGGTGSGNCCSASSTPGMANDPCRILNDGQCQCPLSAEEAKDCASQPDLVGGVRLVEDLATKYERMTRITTRLSADEMTFDPMFAPDASVLPTSRFVLTAQNDLLSATCESDVIEHDRYDQLKSIQGCATVYCGRGTCAATATGVGCRCDKGQVARAYTDLDDQSSVTCVPEKAPVDLAAGGIMIPDICSTLTTLQSGSCVNLAGFAGVRCGNAEAAVLDGSAVAPSCHAITHDSATSGARNYSTAIGDVRICAAKPPSCDAHYGWLEETGIVQRASVERCASSVADPSWLDVPPKPLCPTVSPTTPDAGTTAGTVASANPTRLIQPDTTKPRSGMASNMGGCRASNGQASATGMEGLWIALVLLLQCRRHRHPGALA